MDLKNYINLKDNIWFLTVKITPKASKSEFFSVLSDGTLKIRIKAVPENGKANKELISFLAKELWINKQNIEIVSWKTETKKRIKIKM